MNILLIYPEFPDTFWSFKHALKFISRRAFSPPLGLLTVAAMLPREWQKRLVDTNVSTLTDEDLSWADYVFISGMTVQRKSAQEIIERCKNAGVKVVAGGPLFMSEHDQFDKVDHFVLNEAELTLPSFLEDLERGEPRRIYSTSEFADMEESPVPLWELLDMDKYAEMSIQYSRGCPFNCDFCNVTALFGHRPRTKTSEQIIAELNALYRLGWRGGVFFVDDNLVGNKGRLKRDLLPALIKWRKGKKFGSFSTEVSINLADDMELVQMMVKAGFSNVFVGIETPDENSLAECSKKQNMTRNLIKDVRRLQRAGLQVTGGFIIGFDSDTPSIFQRQIDFIQKSGIVTAMVGLLQAPPGTKLYERLKTAGRVLDRMSGDNVDGTTNIIPKMNPKILHEGYRKVLKYIYSPGPYYRRIRNFLHEYRAPKRDIPNLGLKKKTDYIMAFLKSVYKLGIKGKDRVHYWYLLLWTLCRRPKSFPLAVTLAIYGYHFRKICEKTIS